MSTGIMHTAAECRGRGDARDVALNRRLARALRQLEVADRGGVLPVGRSWDVVVTRDGACGAALLRSMDHHARPGRCASVIADPQHRLLMWLAPLGTMRVWRNDHGLCMGNGEIAVPPLACTAPSSRTHWARPMRQHDLVDPEVLDRELRVAALGQPLPAVIDLLPSRANAP